MTSRQQRCHLPGGNKSQLHAFQDAWSGKGKAFSLGSLRCSALGPPTFSIIQQVTRWNSLIIIPMQTASAWDWKWLKSAPAYLGLSQVHLPLPFKLIQAKISKPACLRKDPLNDSWLCLFCGAQVMCDLTFMFAYACFQSGWVFYFISSKSKRPFLFCQSESSYIHSAEKGSSRVWTVTFKGHCSSVTVTSFHSHIKVAFIY